MCIFIFIVHLCLHICIDVLRLQLRKIILDGQAYLSKKINRTYVLTDVQAHDQVINLSFRLSLINEDNHFHRLNFNRLNFKLP